MLTDFLININRLGCAPGRGRVLLAVSGGVDSVVMCRLFAASGVECGVAHCNFQLRGEESDADAALVRQLAFDLGFPFHEVAFPTQKLAGEWKMSTQMTARKLRYDWFSELALQYEYDFIATAHHAGDQVETVLLNLVRGAGIRGLRGMPEQNGRVVRPMLFATRDAMVQYAEENGIAWREDRSNHDVYYRRNRIRHQVVPVLKSINPSLEQTVLEMSQKLKGAEALLNALLHTWKESVWEDDGVQARISVAGVRKAISPAYQLYSLLEPSGFSYSQVMSVLDTLDGPSGKLFYSTSHVLLKDRDFLLLKPLLPPGDDTPRETLKIAIFPRPAEFEVQQERFTAFFDADRLKMPLSVRAWQPGDSFRPYGMEGRRKKVSDLLVDRKLSRLDKAAVKVLVDADQEIVWVIGLRGGHKAAVTDHTRNIARVSLSEG